MSAPLAKDVNFPRLASFKKIFWYALILAAFSARFFFSIKTVATGNFSFWFDPARDLLLALQNLTKPTLIGIPTGIPNIFYGPYWIWMLSIGLIFSKDPRLTVFLVLTLPYFTILPLIIYKSRKFFKPVVCFTIWLLFILEYKAYPVQLWNPHFAPLLFFAYLFGLLILMNLQKTHSRKKIFVLFASGVLAGLILNFHMSFGFGVLLGTLIFGSGALFIFRQKGGSVFAALTSLMAYLGGLLMTYIPFIIFESRHGFHQIQAFVYTLQQSFLYNSPVVGQTGFTRSEIVTAFLAKFTTTLALPYQFIKPLLFLALCAFVALFFLKKEAAVLHKKFLLLLACICFGILIIYSSSKNPVYDYHFIGVEVVFFWMMAIFAQYFGLFRKALLIWAVALLINRSATLFQPAQNMYVLPVLASKESIVQKVVELGQNTNYQVTSYNPAIYTYDYDYLFLWKTGRLPTHQPDEIALETSRVFLIVPETSLPIKEDFINYFTPNKNYRTVQNLRFADGTEIFVREKLN